MPLNRYRDQANRLAARLAQSHGIDIPRAAALDAVSAVYNEPSWQALVARTTNSLRARLRSTVSSQPAFSSVENLESLFTSLPAEALRLGTLDNGRSALDISNRDLTSHLLIFASNGYGGRTQLEHLMAQQVLRGGGLLLVDAVTDSRMLSMLDWSVEFSRRSASDRQEYPDEVALDFVDAVTQSRVIHVGRRTQLSTAEAESRDKAVLDRFWSAAYEGWAQMGEEWTRHRGRRRPPFMLVLPSCVRLLDPSWSVRFSHARALGISVVLHAQNFDWLAADDEQANMVLGNTFTKVFFRPPTPDALDNAVRYIEQQSPEGADRIPLRERVSRLGMGQSITVSGRAVHETRSCMVDFP